MLDGWGYVIIAACVIAVTAFVILFIKLKGKRKDNCESLNNIELIIGEKCIVTERIDNNAGCGAARVNGFVWSARSAFDELTFEEGEILQVLAVEGVKLICKK